jgi:hypothetical protein
MDRGKPEVHMGLEQHNNLNGKDRTDATALRSGLTPEGAGTRSIRAWSPSSWVYRPCSRLRTAAEVLPACPFAAQAVLQFANASPTIYLSIT